MSRHRSWTVRLAAALLIAIWLPAPLVGAAADQAQVKLLNTAPGVGPVDLVVDGATARGDVASGTAPDFVRISAGPRNVSIVRSGGGGATLLSADETFAAGKAFELVLLEQGGKLALKVYPVDLSAIARGKARYRFIHAAADAPAIDVLARGGARVAAGLAPLASTGYAVVAEGPARFSVVRAGSTDMRLDTPEARLVAGTVYDFVVIPAEGGRLALLLVTAPSETLYPQASPAASPAAASATGAMAAGWTIKG